MSKRSHKALASATVMSLILTSTLTATNVQAAAEVTRMPGADRFGTAQEVAKQVFGKAENVILVNGLGYADAVSATPLAKQLNAPILLTDASNKPSADLLATLTKLEAKNVYIVGGNAVVTDSMKDELAKSYTVERIAGEAKDGRYGTNAAVAKKVLEKTKATSAVLVSAEGYADALSVASIAATKGMPVLFGNRNEVPEVVKNVAKDLKVMAVGGDAVLPETVLSQVSAERIAKGADRFETNLKVLDHFKADLKFDNIFVAAGGNDMKLKFADALVASAAAAKTGAPVVLNGLGATQTRVDEANKYIKDNMKNKVTIVGGEASVSKDIENNIKGTTPNPGSVTSVEKIEAINLNQFKVAFDGAVDSDSAEDVANYEVDGTKLEKQADGSTTATAATAVAVYDEDSKTATITLAKPRKQNDELTVKVRKGILSEDKNKTLKEFEKKVTFRDIDTPTIKSISVRGNNKLIVEFSEALNLNESQVSSKIKINNKTIKSYGLDTTTAKDSVKDGSKVWSSKVEFYFSDSLPEGTNKLKIEDGDDSALTDIAGFSFKETEQEFKVEKVTTKPEIKNIEATADGKLKIDFDRPMDTETAVKGEYFKINNNKVSEISGAKVKLKKDDTRIQIEGVSTGFEKNSNVLSITEDVKDAYGNKIEKDTRKSFDFKKDEEKPKVVNVNPVDSKTVRVKFSEDVKNSSARNLSNYELKDKDGVDVLKKAKDAGKVQILPSVGEDTDNTDSFDIKFHKDYALTAQKYTLKVKNVNDLANPSNIMDAYETIVNGEDDIAPKAEGAVKKEDKKVSIIFNEEMDESTLTKSENFFYKNDEGEIKDLPSGAKFTASSDSKSVTIEFPSGYSIGNQVKGIGVKNVKDLAGNTLEGYSKLFEGDFSGAGVTKAGLESDTLRLYKDGDDIKADVTFERAIDSDTITESEFKLAGQTPKFTKANGRKVTLTFKTTDVVNAIKAKGVESVLEVTPSATKDENGIVVAAGSQKVYHYEVAPKIAQDSNKKNIWSVNRVAADALEVTIKFDTKIDDSITGKYKDDFKFMATNGKELDVDDVVVKEDTLTFKFKSDADNKTAMKDATDLRINAVKPNIDIQTPDDEADNNVKYEPEDDDEKENIVKVTDKVVINKDALNTSIKDAEAKAEADYTAESWKAMTDKLTVAKYVAGKSDATQKEVDTAKADLDTVVTALVAKVTVPAHTTTIDTSLAASLGQTGVIVVLAEGTDLAKWNVEIDGTVVKAANGKYVANVSKVLTQAEADKLVKVVPAN